MSDPLLQGLLAAAGELEATFSSPSSAQIPPGSSARDGGVRELV